MMCGYCGDDPSMHDAWKLAEQHDIDLEAAYEKEDTVVDLAPVDPPTPLVEPDWFLEMEYEDRFRSDLDE